MFPRLEYVSQVRVAGRLGHRLDNPVGERDFFLPRAYRLALGPIQPHTWWIPGALFLGIKWPEHQQSSQSTPSSAEVKSEWSLNSTVPYAFMACTRTNLPVLVL
jgi:hypothetical protein